MKCYTKEEVKILMDYYSPILHGRPVDGRSNVFAIEGIAIETCSEGFRLKAYSSYEGYCQYPYSYLDDVTRILKLESPDQVLHKKRLK